MEKSKKIIISGYYGLKNFGDEAILQTLIDRLNSAYDKPEITVISKNPEYIKQTYKADSVYSFNFSEISRKMSGSDIFISGGGSLLQDVTSLMSLFYYLALILLAQIFKTRVYIFAQGIGPINNPFGRFLTGIILKNASLITVRDQNSSDFLSKLGVKSIQTTDPVWCINSSEMDFPELDDDKIKVGIQLREWKDLNNKTLDIIKNTLVKNFDKNYQFILISLQDSQDLETLDKLETKLQLSGTESVIFSGLTVDKAVSLISKLDINIAMRYHACLISIKYGIPTLALSYDPKVSSLAEEAGVPFLDINNLNEEGLSVKIKELIEKKEYYRDILKEFSIKNELKSRQNFDLLIKIIDTNGLLKSGEMME